CLSYKRNNQSWFAYVQGTESYYVDVNLDGLAEGKLKSYCECPAFTTYHSCKHIVAVLLSIQQENSKVLRTNRHVTSTFIDEISKWQDDGQSAIMDKIPMVVSYHLTIDEERHMQLELKTGIDHRYVVHDIRAFLESVFAHETHVFTKKFTYDPQEHLFLQKDLNIFKQLQTIIQTGDIFTQNLYLDTRHRYDRRHLLLPPFALKELLY